MGFSLPIATDGLGEPASQFRIIIDTVKACGRCVFGVVGPTWPSRRAAWELQNARVAERSGMSVGNA
jgi:hypothetical protein